MKGKWKTLYPLNFSKIHLKDNIFIIKNREILHVSQINGAKCVFREDRKRKRIVIWEIPSKEIENCEALWVSYSNSGYLDIYLIKFPDTNELEKVEKLDYSTLMKYIIVDNTERVLNRIKTLRFRELGKEHNMCVAYFKYVPKLVKDFWKSMKKLGISEVYMGGHRLEEVIQDPELGYITSMLLPSEQGRVLSLHKKLSGMFELWILSKIAEALGQLGKLVNSKKWIFLEYTKNNKILEFDIHGNKYAIFYQPTIAPHVISGCLSEDELNKLKKQLGVKELHLIPDIVIAKDVSEYLNWGQLYKIKNKIKLIVEAKLSLKGVTTYETIDRTKSQLEAYTKILNANILIVILEPNKDAKFMLERYTKAKVVDDALNNADEIVNTVKCLLALH